MDKADSPWHDIRVRQALNMAVDKAGHPEEIISRGRRHPRLSLPAQQTMGKVLHRARRMPKTPQLPGSVATVNDLWTYNPDKARQILKDAGYPTGSKSTIEVKPSAPQLTKSPCCRASADQGGRRPDHQAPGQRCVQHQEHSQQPRRTFSVRYRQRHLGSS